MLNILFLGCNYVFKKFTLLCAISNSKCVGATLYKEGGMTKERFVEFLETNIFNKYKNYLIILCNSSIVICSFSFNFCIAYLTCSLVIL